MVLHAIKAAQLWSGEQSSETTGQPYRDWLEAHLLAHEIGQAASNGIEATVYLIEIWFPRNQQINHYVSAKSAIWGIPCPIERKKTITL